MAYLITIASLYFFLNLYKYIWNKLFLKRVPTGSGIILALTYTSLIFFDLRITENIQASLVIISLMTFFYWIDDIFGLPIITRILLQFSIGVILFYIFSLNEMKFVFHFPILFYFIFFGTLSILFSNTINFYDGEDLNIVILALINFSILFFLIENNQFLNLLIITTMLYFVSFSFLNFKPRNIYFGDAGCFLLSSTLILFLCHFSQNDTGKLVYMIMGLALPIFDVIFVVIMRIKMKESLFTRHNYQIYQIIKRQTNYPIYLLIQPANVILIILNAHLIDYYLSKINLSIIISSIITTVIFYIILRISFRQINE